MGKRKYVIRTVYYVMVCKGKVVFLGSDFQTVMDRANKDGVHDMHRISATSYSEAARTAAESLHLQLSEDVQSNIKLLRGYKK